MTNNLNRAVPVTLQQAVQAGSIGSHRNIPALPIYGISIGQVRVPTNTGGVSRPGIGTRPIATPILATRGMQNYPMNPGVVIRPIGVRPVAPVGPTAPHWGHL